MFAMKNFHRPAVRCRCEAPSGSNGVVSVVTREPEQDAKQIKQTINSLDALLGEQAKPKVEPPSPSTPARPAAPPASQAGVFNWPGQGPVSPRPAASAGARKTQQTFASVMSFEGLAPEIINGRAAMLGFLYAFSAELSNGESVYSQVISGGGLRALIVIAAVTLASFAPAIRGVPLDEVFNKNPKKMRAFGPFAADSELINGRAAMVGLAVIMILEGTSGTAFFL